ncbi:MAG: single-stranded-DNA-specific exonuclease RecJ [Planctomycetota bacterium]
MMISKTGIFRKLSGSFQRQWILSPDPGPVRREIAGALSLSEITARILASRLPEPTIEAARAFLHPSLTSLHDPWKLACMETAVDRLARAVRNREKIVIYGDYDSDGVTACALLLRAFQAVGSTASYYLPDRVEEGYGLSESFTRQALREGVDLVVTVDCGVSDFTEVATLQEGGVDVIVTDHHEPGDELPRALAVINPKRRESTYPFRHLVGVGVAFKLAWALFERLSGSRRVRPELRQTLLDILPLVALGTITDVAPLQGENRVYAAYGLNALARTTHPGLNALLEVSNLSDKALTPRDVSFRLGPRINAAGRMQNAYLALEVLMATDPAVARAKAFELDRENNNRQHLCQTIYEEARAFVEEHIDLDKTTALVVVGEGWHEGVIGIVASRLVEEFNRPSVVIALAPDGLRGKGSARSIPGLHLYRAMNRSRQRFESFGGHEMAAGFSLMRDQIEPFCREFNHECRLQVAEGGLAPELVIDLDIHLRQLSEEFAREIDLLAPFGRGNESPLFLSRHVKVAGTPQILGSQGKHFSFFASQEQVAFRALVFNHTEWLERMDHGTDYWDIVYTLSLNDYYEPPRLELRIADMRPS